MSKYSLYIFILTIIFLLLIVYSNYKLTSLRDYNKSRKSKFNRLIYLVSIALIVLSIGIWYSYRENNTITNQEITELQELNVRLQKDNNQLVQDGLNLRNGKKELTNENVTISNNNDDLSTKIQELRTIIYRKDQQIKDLENRLKQKETSVPQNTK